MVSTHEFAQNWHRTLFDHDMSQAWPLLTKEFRRVVTYTAIAQAKGKYVQQPKLSDDDVEQIQMLLDLGYPKTQIAKQFEVSRQTVYNALRRQGQSVG